MSVPLIITGTIDEIHAKLSRIQAIINHRRVVGWPLFQRGERWLYTTHPTIGHVCPTCKSHEGLIFDGEEVVSTFPYKEVIEPGLVLPHTHLPHLQHFMNTPCNCDLTLQNPAEVMELRLHEEKLEVI